MLSSVLDSLRAWPAVRRSTLSLLLPSVDGATAWVDDIKVAAALRALGYVVARPGSDASAACDASAARDVSAASDASDKPSPQVLAVALRARAAKGMASSPDALDRVRAEALRLPAGGWLLLRAPRRDQERVAAAFLHAGLAQVSQAVLRRSVLTVGKKRPTL